MEKVAPALVARPTSATHIEKTWAQTKRFVSTCIRRYNTKMLSGTKVKRFHISAAQKGHSSAGDLGQAPGTRTTEMAGWLGSHSDSAARQPGNQKAFVPQSKNTIAILFFSIGSKWTYMWVCVLVNNKQALGPVCWTDVCAAADDVDGQRDSDLAWEELYCSGKRA